MAKTVLGVVVRTASCLALVGLFTAGCGPFEDQWQDAKSCMESRGADGQGNADFRDDSSADNGYTLRLRDRASGSDWKVTMFFFDDAQSATEAMAAYFISFPTYTLHRKGRVFVAWDTIPGTDWGAVPVTAEGLGDRPQPPRLLRRDIVDPCLSHQ